MKTWPGESFPPAFPAFRITVRALRVKYGTVSIHSPGRTDTSVTMTVLEFGDTFPAVIWRPAQT